MENKELKVGQRIKLYKVLEECRVSRELLPVGSFMASYDVDIDENICQILTNSTDWWVNTPIIVCHTEFTYNPKSHPVDVKPIGEMIIKSIKYLTPHTK